MPVADWDNAKTTNYEKVSPHMLKTILRLSPIIHKLHTAANAPITPT